MKEEQKVTDKYNITDLKILTPNDVENMMVGAWEGGSHYWAYVSDNMMKKVYEKTADMKDEAAVCRVIMAVQRGLKVRVRDAEEPSTILGVLTPESWAKGEELMLKNQRKHFADILGENDDATTADVFFQFCVMGELVYG